MVNEVRGSPFIGGTDVRDKESAIRAEVISHILFFEGSKMA